MKNLLKKALVAFVLGAVFLTSSAFASGEKFYVVQLYKNSSTEAGATFTPVSSSGVLGSYQDVAFVPSSWTEDSYRADLGTAIAGWANSHGYSGITSNDVVSYSPILAPIARSGSSSDLNNSGVTAGTYPSVTVNAKGIVTAGVAPSDGYTSRSLNTCFQVSSTRSSFVNYAVDIAATLSLTSGQSGTVTMNTYSDSGCTTGTQKINEFTNGNTGSLTIGLNLTQNVTGTITGFIPAGKYVKLVTTNNTGTPTFTAKSSQEVLW